MRQEDTASLVKSVITSEFRELKRDLNINPVNSKSTSLNRKYSDDTCVIKYTGNKKQFDFNVSILEKIAEVKDSLKPSSIEDTEGLLEGIIKDIEARIKLIRIADKTEEGWAAVEEYQTSDLEEDSDDDKKKIVRRMRERCRKRENCSTGPD